MGVSGPLGPTSSGYKEVRFGRHIFAGIDPATHALILLPTHADTICFPKQYLKPHYATILAIC